DGSARTRLSDLHGEVRPRVRRQWALLLELLAQPLAVDEVHRRRVVPTGPHDDREVDRAQAAVEAGDPQQAVEQLLALWPVQAVFGQQEQVDVAGGTQARRRGRAVQVEADGVVADGRGDQSCERVELVIHRS